MKHNQFSQDQKQQPAGESRLAGFAGQTQSGLTPSADEVARKAYFAYVNQGSPPGCDVQHWLEAQAKLIAERKLTRAHGFHNRN